MIHRIAGIVHLKMYHFKIMLIHKFLDLLMLPKLLITMNGIKLDSEAPTQEQEPHQQEIPYKVKYRSKF